MPELKRSQKMEPVTMAAHAPEPSTLADRPFVRDCNICNGLGVRAVGKVGPDDDLIPYEDVCASCHGTGRKLTPRGQEVAEVVRLVMGGRAGVGA